MWSQYSKTRCSFLFLLKTSSRFTRLGCFSCCNTVEGLVSYCTAGGVFGEKRGMRRLHPPGAQFLELKPFAEAQHNAGKWHTGGAPKANARLGTPRAPLISIKQASGCSFSTLLSASGWINQDFYRCFCLSVHFPCSYQGFPSLGAQTDPYHTNT